MYLSDYFIVSVFVEKICVSQKKVVPLRQHAYPASHMNSALRVSYLFLYPMEKKSFSKKFISIEEQIQLLKQRGLCIEDNDKVAHILRNISYYRLSGYWYPFLKDKKYHSFKTGSTFVAAYTIYKFDSELRKLILTELEKIEVAVRTQITYILSMEYNGFWFVDSSLFSDLTKQTKILSKINDEYQRSDEEFIKAFKQKYSDSYPPSWMIMEITSFGTLSMLYANLRPSKVKRNIARYFGLSDTVFTSWLHSIVYVRNICAHHSRLWNRRLSIRPLIPRSPQRLFINAQTEDTKYVYYILCMIIYMLNIINPNHSFIQRFDELLMKYPSIDVRAMGFPKDWQSESIWNK